MGKPKCFIINKPFIGEYVSADDDRQAHELIDFFLADDGNYYLYNNPYGQNIAHSENYDIVGMFFASPSFDKKFYIEYYAPIKAVLHRQIIGRTQVKNKQKMGQKRTAASDELTDNCNKLGINYEQITYGGLTFDQLFRDNPPLAPVTFLAGGMYKAKKPIYLGDDLLPTRDYQLAHNFGYVSERDEPLTYRCLEKLLPVSNSNWIQNPVWERLDVSAIKKRSSHDLLALDPSLFLDFVSLSKSEEAYTKILFHLFQSSPQLINVFILAYLDSINLTASSCVKPSSFVPPTPDQKKAIGGERFDISSEESIGPAGRLDLYAESLSCQLIIENKINSSIGYNEKKGDQLSRYYDALRSKKLLSFFLVLAPDSRIELLAAQVSDLPGDGKGHYGIIGYGFLFDFFSKHLNEMKSGPFGKYAEDTLLLFKRLSFSHQHLCELKLVRDLP